MLASWRDGRIKLYVAYKALNTRRGYPELFQKGEFIPLIVEGDRRGHVCAFARRYGKKWALVAVPRFFTKLSALNELPFGKQAWGDDRIILSDNTPHKWLSVFTGETVSGGKDMALAELFRKFPVAMLMNG